MLMANLRRMLFASLEIILTRENCARWSNAVAGREPPKKCISVLGVAG